MCLYLKEQKPRVAKEDITVLKYVKVNDKVVTSPLQNTVIHANEVLTASPDKADIFCLGKDLFDNDTYSLNRGAIHAKLIKGGFSNCECRKAIIPSGTEYWVSVRGDEIAARSMIITDVDWDNGDNKVSDCIFEEILKNAQEVNGIRIGDYLLENGEYTKPRKGLSEDEVVGIVAGFHEEEPLIAALTYFVGAFDKMFNSSFGFFYGYDDVVIKRFNGRYITEEYKVGDRRNKRFEAFEACINYRKNKDEKWYLGAAGEVATMLDNCIYLNAAHHITSLGFLMGDEWYNSCTEGGRDYFWGCYLRNSKLHCRWYYKDDKNKIVPFLSL